MYWTISSDRVSKTETNLPSDWQQGSVSDNSGGVLYIVSLSYAKAFSQYSLSLCLVKLQSVTKLEI